jgi:hypothetical protein
MSWREDCKNEAAKLTKEKRQEFLDYLVKEHLNVGDSYKKAGISFDAANGIMMAQIEEVAYLNTTAK